MITAKEGQNKMLISLTDGKKIGEIKDIYFNREATEIAAALVGRQGMFKPRLLVVDRSAIQVFGLDVWLTTDSNVITELAPDNDAASLVLVSDLRGREVVTEGGTKIGTVGDVVLDNAGHTITYQLDKVFVKGPVADKKVIPVNAVREPGLKATERGATDRPMIIDLAVAETYELPTPESAPAPAQEEPAT